MQIHGKFLITDKLFLNSTFRLEPFIAHVNLYNDLYVTWYSQSDEYESPYNDLMKAFVSLIMISSR